MGSKHFDYVVIGGGSAGYAAARTARESVGRVAIIDDGPELGGLCILRGCMPSKTLIYSSEVLHLAQQAEKFGLKIPEAKADMAAIHQRKVSTIEDFASYRREQLQSERFHLIRDRARFTDDRSVVLDQCGDTITADHFMIATGSVVNTPEIPGLSETPHWTSDDVLDLDYLPESVIILGGGTVACELAQFLQRVGTRVIQIQRSSHILKETSQEAGDVVAQAMRDDGIELYTGTQLTAVGAVDGGVTAEFTKDGETYQVRAAHLFNALGRNPNTKNLNLSAASVEIRDSGLIKVDRMQQTSNPRIHGAGDVTGPYEIVHLAIMQGELAAKHALNKSPEAIDYEARTGVIFTDPQVATVGLSVADAKERGMDLVTADYPFDDHGKSILMEAKYGYVKAWADRASGKLVGAECVGKDAGELIHAMAVGISLESTPAQLMKVHWYHPTLSEIWSYPLEDLAEVL